MRDASEVRMGDLLPSDALKGKWLGVSVSESPDLGRLGLFEAHLRLALAEITRAVIVAGGGVIYGGHLKRDGYTEFMRSELQRYARRDRPLLVCLAWQIHRGVSLSDYKQFERDLGVLGRIVCLDPTGNEVDPFEGRGEEAITDFTVEERQRALTAMRRYMRDRQDGRVLVGGRREGYEGELPGLMEEALLALEAGQPLYLAGGFGGITLDIARALGVDDGSWARRAEPATVDPRYAAGYARLTEVARSPGWTGLNNGLSDEENRRLVASHRPSDIAALIALGLGRLATTS